MRWLLYGLLGLVVAFIAGLFVLPGLIDWNDYRPRIESYLAAATGMDVRLQGPISASLLPTPRLILTQIEISDPGAPLSSVGIRWIGADASFPALLQGRVQITGVTVVEPTLNMTGFTAPGAVQGSDAATDSAAGQQGDDGDFDYRIKGPVDITDGTVVWANGESSTKINGTLDVDGGTGRLAGSLSAIHRETPFDITLRLSGDLNGVEARVQATISPKTADATVEVTGNLEMAQPQGLQFDGSIVATIDEPSATLKPWLPGLAPVLASSGAIRIETAARLTDSTVDLQSIRFESPGGSGKGYVTLNLAGGERADINLQFSRLDIDALRSQAASDSRAEGIEAGQAAGGSTTGSAPGDNDVSGIIRAFGATGMDATIAVSVDAVRLNGSLIRNAVLRASVDDGAVTMEEFSALLPGGSSASLAGFGTIGAESQTFEGNMSMRADDLRRLMAWASLRVPDVAADRLRSMDFVSGIKYAGNRLDLVDAALSIDGIDAEVSAAIALRQRPGIGLRLTIERLNLDAYRVLGDDNNSTVSAGDGGQLPEGGSTPPENTGVIEAPAFDAIIDLTIDQLIVAGVPIKALKGRVEYRDGQLRTDALTFADAGGLAGSAMGEFDVGMASLPGSATVRGHAEDLGALAAVLGASDTIATRIRKFGESDVTVVYEQGQVLRNLGFEIAGSNGNVSADLSWQPVGEDIETRVENGALQYGMLEARDIGFLAVTRSSGDVTVTDISGTINKGVLTGDLVAAGTGSDYTGKGNFSISGMPVGLTLEGLRDEVATEGKLTVAGTVTFGGGPGAATESGFRIDGSVSGALSLTIPEESQSAVRVARIEQIREILDRSFSETPKPVEGRLTATDSAVTTSGITVNGDGGARVTLTGRADFSTETVAAEVLVSSGSDTPQRLAITGPLSKPSLRLSD